MALAMIVQLMPAFPMPREQIEEIGLPATLESPARATTEVQPSASTTSSPAEQAQLTARIAELPLSFEANRGQAPASLDFVARGPGYIFGLTASEIVLALRRANAAPVIGDELDASGAAIGSRTRIVTLGLVGARPDVPPVALAELPGKVNYFIGNDPTRWRSGISTYERVRYDGVYPGIDVVHYGNGRQLEFDVVVAPVKTLPFVKRET